LLHHSTLPSGTLVPCQGDRVPGTLVPCQGDRVLGGPEAVGVYLPVGPVPPYGGPEAVGVYLPVGPVPPYGGATSYWREWSRNELIKLAR